MVDNNDVLCNNLNIETTLHTIKNIVLKYLLEMYEKRVQTYGLGNPEVKKQGFL